ncbi:circadian clock protein KaiC [Desulfosporosinus sp. SYSU MS00001]|uniref:circadian clock protein KaiC n=1 Tax=Desulfosporosinus sp. SYSU MS00001 TaxID=3416284 RepID=UPI003CF32AB6
METQNQNIHGLTKCPTGIQGLDEITFGGLPKGRTALVCGSAGCGKTLLAMQFLVNGALDYQEPGVFMSFEENEVELRENFASLGIDLNDLETRKLVTIDHVYFDRDEITETGDYDLEGLFVRLNYAIDSIGAKRVVLDTIEALFSGLSQVNLLRSELRRLFRWLKDKGVTAIVTGEKGDGSLTRHGIEEYVSDCVLLLDHKVTDQVSTRRLRVVKYRGSAHGTNEYPFLIDEQGISILPITSVGLTNLTPTKRISTGISRLDAMLGGDGIYEGSAVLISGTAGTGKTSSAAHFANAACSRGEKVIYFAFEESEKQIVRNMASIGIDLQQWINNNLLQVVAARPTLLGLEAHLVSIYKKVTEFTPQLVVLDPISNLVAVGDFRSVKSMLTRLLDLLKLHKITVVLLDLSNLSSTENTDIGISSLTDTWISLRDIEINGERNRGLYILKSRGMAHSNQIREFVLTKNGIDLLDVYTGSEGVLTGSARYAQEAKEKAELVLRQEEILRKRRQITRKQQALETAIIDLKRNTESEIDELEKLIVQEERELTVKAQNKDDLAQHRKAD